MHLPFADIHCANAQGPHTSRRAFQLLQYLSWVLLEVGVYDDFDFRVTLSHGNRPAAED